jgi:hypothetical protein
MGYEQRAYEDLDSTGQMLLDCAACADRVDLPRERRLGATAPAPVHPWSTPRRDVDLAAAAAHQAGRLHLG